MTVVTSSESPPHAPPSRARTPGSGGGLLQVLGVGFGIAVLVGNTIGMGILRTPGEVARHLPSVPLFLGVWVISALYALLGTLTMAEMAAMRPRSGGMFPIVHHALGPFPGFVAGWTDWFTNAGSAAAVAMVLAEYLSPLVPGLGGREAFVATGTVIGLALLQWRGIRLGNVVQQGASLVKGIALIGLAVVALAMSGGLPESATSAPALVVPGGLALAAAVVIALQSAIYTYDGWTGPIYFGEEVKNPGRDIPRSMIGGVLVVLAIYLAMNIAFLRIIPIHEMAGDPFVAATAATRLFGSMGDTILRVIMVISMAAAVNAIILLTSRIPYAMSRGGMLPAMLQRVNAGGTPVNSLMIGAFLSVGFILTNTIDTVLAVLAFFMVANYALVFIGFFRLRWRDADAPRPFRTPWYPVVPGLALLGSVAFLVAAVIGDPQNSAVSIGLIVLSWPASIGARRYLAGAVVLVMIGCGGGEAGDSASGQGAEATETIAVAPDSAFTALQARGAEAMGVDQYTSTHIFEDRPDGGRIVLQRDSADAEGTATIREHMREIASRFSAGDFSIPGMVHAQEVPGSAVMASRRERIMYIMDTLPRGAQVRILAGDRASIAAVHEFLAFQRMDHRAAGHDMKH